MKKSLSTSIILIFLSIQSWAVERFPPPDFSPGYKMPVLVTPAPRAEWFTFLDIGMLVLTLTLATYFAIFRRSRRGLVILSITSLLYFGFYRHGCICPIGSIQNAALSIFGSGYAMPVAVGMFFLLPLIFALFAGRVFCSSVCPLGAIQELVLVKPLKVPQWLSHVLGGIPWIYLGFAVLFAATGCSFIICKYDPFVPFFRFGGPVEMIITGSVFLVIGLFIGRPYCRFFCPYGALLRLLSPFSRWRITVTPDKCIKCRLCENACPYGEIRYATQDRTKVGTTEGRRRLLLLLTVLPVLMVSGYFAGKYAAPSLAVLHPEVRLAHQLYNEAHIKGTTTNEESDAVRLQNRPKSDVYKAARSIEADFATGTPLLGVFLGLVFGIRLISLNVRRHREDYEADSGGCVACGRCYSSCPVELAKHGDPEAIRILEEYS